MTTACGPIRPADAFCEVAELLPPTFFLVPPALIGLRLTIIGDDDIPTQWDFDIDTAKAIARVFARRRTGTRIVGSRKYDDRMRHNP